MITRFPALNVTFTHSGWGGDRVTGGGGGPIDLRLARDVFPYRPTVMTIMLGMNDGNYKAFDDGTFHAFTSGMEHILDSVHQTAPDCRITLIEPSPYDDVTRAPLFAGGYNAVLLKFSDYLGNLARTRHLDVADLNNPVTAMLGKALAADPEQSQKILPDRVHPAAAGHIVMAAALLKACERAALVERCCDRRSVRHSAHTQNAKVVDVKTGPQIAWTETEAALPMPIDLRDKLLDLTLKSSGFVDALDREMLRVTGLTATSYELKIDGLSAGRFPGGDRAGGVNLATLNTPMLRQALEVHAPTLKHNNIHFARWRTIETGLATDGSPATRFEVQAALDQAGQRTRRRTGVQPRSLARTVTN